MLCGCLEEHSGLYYTRKKRGKREEEEEEDEDVDGGIAVGLRDEKTKKGIGERERELEGDSSRV